MFFLLLIVLLGSGVSSDLVAGEQGAKKSTAFFQYLLNLNNNAINLRKNRSVKTFNIVPLGIECEFDYDDCCKKSGKIENCEALRRLCYDEYRNKKN